MTSQNWSLVQFATRFLNNEERETVLGDLAEAHEGAWQGFFGVLGLVARRQAQLWKNWRPWLAGFGVALPSSFLLMGASLSLSWSYQRLLCPELLRATSLTRGSGLVVLLYQGLLLIGWSWAVGFVVGSTSKKTIWASTLLCYAPCLFCLLRYRNDSIPRICLLLFLVPAIWGLYGGLRISRMQLGTAMLLAISLTFLTVFSSGGFSPDWSSPRLNLNWMLIFPAWYLVLTSRKHEETRDLRSIHS
jgi:hypothetical protein